jgi:hypothetical protein
MGSEQSDLEVMHPIDPVYLCGEPMASIMDYKPMINIKPFGQCSSLANPTVAAATAANYGRLQKMPCIPNIVSPWMPGKMDVLVRGQPALLETDKCMCMWASPIEITNPGQDKVQTGSGGVDASPNVETSASVMADTQSSFASSGQNSQQAVGNQFAGSNAQAQVSAGAGTGTVTAVSLNTATNEQSPLFVKTIEGAVETYPRQKIVYKVTKYSKMTNEMSDEDKNKKINWRVKIGNDIITPVDSEEKEFTGEKITLDINKAWEGKDILVMAYITNSGETSFKTKVLLDSFKGTLIRGVEGESEATPGQKIEYETNSCNKDSFSFDNNGIKWDVKVKLKGKQQPERLKDEKGKEIPAEKIRGEKTKIEIKEEWLGGELIVMPHLNKPTETVSVKTKIVSLGLKVTEMLKEMQRNREKKQEAILNGSFFIKKFIQELSGYDGMDTRWLEDIKEIDCPIEIGNQLEVPRQVENELRMVKVDNDTLAHTLVGRGNRNIYVQINLNHEFFKNKAVLDSEFDKEMQIILLHEFVHVWQQNNNDWRDRVTNNEKIRKEQRALWEIDLRNIYIEVEAYDLQFEYEKKINTDSNTKLINTRLINDIRDEFSKCEQIYPKNPNDRSPLTESVRTALTKKASFLLGKSDRNGYFNPT